MTSTWFNAMAPADAAQRRLSIRIRLDDGMKASCQSAPPASPAGRAPSNIEATAAGVITRMASRGATPGIPAMPSPRASAKAARNVDGRRRPSP